MSTSRRKFIGASSSMAALATSVPFAQAAPADTTRWIGLLHSTTLDPDLEQAFFGGLRTKNWEADPTQPVTGPRQRVNLRRVNANGKYRMSSNDELNRAADDLKDHTPNLQCLVAFGGLVSGHAVARLTGIPLFVVLGRYDQAVAARGQVGGYFFDKPQGVAQNSNMLEKFTRLTGTYGIQPQKICLLYNGNSQMGSAESVEWNGMNAQGQALDARTSGGGPFENKGIKLRDAIDDANKALDAIDPKGASKAIILSADPFFTSKRQRIIRLAQKYNSLVMCYPLREYMDDAVDPDTNDKSLVMYQGPTLKVVYSDIGKMVGDLLTTPGTALALTQARSDYDGLP
ncbi:MAG: hypothetical protein ACJ8F3_07430 [Xanthobacteraceae bacterium]